MYQHPSSAAFPFAQVPGFKACVVNNGDPPLSGRTHNEAGMSASKCVGLCRNDGYHYAGVDPLNCYCGTAGDDYRRHGVVPNTECMSLCRGEALQSCGNDRRVAVHEGKVAFGLHKSGMEVKKLSEWWKVLKNKIISRAGDEQ